METKDNSLEKLYGEMCKSQGITPKTREEMKQEEYKEAQERRKKIEAKKSEHQRYQMSFRIINKSKEGVILAPQQKRSVDITQKISWGEFESNFEYTSETKKKCRFTKEAWEKMKEIEDLTLSGVVYLRKIRVAEMKGNHGGSYLTNLAVFGDICEKIAKLTGCSELEASQLIGQKHDQFLGALNSLS